MVTKEELATEPSDAVNVPSEKVPGADVVVVVGPAVVVGAAVVVVVGADVVVGAAVVVAEVVVNEAPV